MANNPNEPLRLTLTYGLDLQVETWLDREGVAPEVPTPNRVTAFIQECYVVKVGLVTFETENTSLHKISTWDFRAKTASYLGDIGRQVIDEFGERYVLRCHVFSAGKTADLVKVKNRIGSRHV